MATAHVQTKTKQVASGTTAAVSLTGVGAGNHLAASTVTGGAQGSALSTDPLLPTSATGTFLNAIAGFVSNQTTMAQRADYSENTASGAWTVTIKSNTTKEITGCVSESSGVATSSSKGAVNHAASGTAVASLQPGTITPATGSIVYTAVADDGGLTTVDTINLSYTVSSDPAGGTGTCWDGANQRGGQAHLDNVANVGTNPTWTLPSGTNNMVATIVEYLAAAGGGGATAVPPPMRTMRGAGV